MKCPICGKELEIQKKQIGIDEIWSPILNEFAVCRDCKKKWNLDKQRAKKNAASAGAAATSAVVGSTTSKLSPTNKLTGKLASDKTQTIPTPPVAKTDSAKPADKPASSAPVKKTPDKDAQKPVPKKKKKIPSDFSESSHRENPAKSSNTPAKKAKPKAAPAAKKSKEKPVKAAPAKTKKKKTTAKAKPVRKARFKIIRIILGVLSIVGGAYYLFRAGMAGIRSLANLEIANNGTTLVILGLCLLVAGLFSICLKNVKNVLGFLLPLLFYIGSAIYTFIQRGSDQYLEYGAIASAVMAVIFLLFMLIANSLNTKADQVLEEDYEHDSYDDDDYDDDDYYD